MAANKKEFTLQSLTAHYSIEEITTIFSNIDQQIMSLHESSARDFGIFNSQLKEYHGFIKEVANNIDEIFKLLANQDKQSSQAQFYAFYEELSEHMIQTQNTTHDVKNALEKLHGRVQGTVLPLKNVNQDLMTLKFLLANLRVNFKDFFVKQIDNFEKQTDYLETNLQQIRAQYPGIQKKTNQLNNGIIERIKQAIEEMQRRLQSAEAILESIHKNIRLITSNNERITEHLPEFHEGLQEGFNNVDKIITKIQYHDIIRQKMQNIQTTHKELIRELEDLNVPESKQIVLFKQAKYASQIPYIAEIQIAQLIYTNKEYQEAIESITQTFHEMNGMLLKTADLSAKLTQENDLNLATDYEKAKHSLNQATEVIYTIQRMYGKITGQASEISTILQELDKDFDDLKALEQDMQALSGKVSTIVFQELTDKDLAKVGLQIKNLTADITLTINNCASSLNYALKHDKELHQFFDLLPADNVSMTQNLCNQANDLMSQIGKENEYIKQVLEKNKELSILAAQKMRHTLQQINYYDFYEQKTENIILELNRIYETLKQVGKNQATEGLSDKDKMEFLKRLYTTESEHQVHDEVLKKQQQQHPHQAASDEPDEEDQQDKQQNNNIEFF